MVMITKTIKTPLLASLVAVMLTLPLHRMNHVITDNDINQCVPGTFITTRVYGS